MSLKFKQILSHEGFLVGLTEEGDLYQLWGHLRDGYSGQWAKIDYPVQKEAQESPVEPCEVPDCKKASVTEKGEPWALCEAHKEHWRCIRCQEWNDPEWKRCASCWATPASTKPTVGGANDAP